MTCNLAVSITKAAIPAEQAEQLLDDETVAQAVREYLKALGYVDGSVETYDNGYASGVFAQIPSISATIYVQKGRVDVSASRYAMSDAAVADIAAGLEQLIAALAQQALGEQVAAALKQLGEGAPVSGDVVEVDDEGQTVVAFQYKLSL